MFKRILLLITPSNMCARAADTAVALAGRCGARLYVLCVLHAAEHCWDVLFSGPPPEEAEARKAAMDAHFRARLAEAAGEGGAGCAVETTCGFSDVEAQRFAWRIGADLIVLGCDPDAPEADRPGRAGQGECVARLCQGARCPVLMVFGPGERAGEGEGARPISRILAATDFSRESGHAVRFAAELALAFGAGLDVLHVLEGPRDQPGETLEEIRRSLAAHYEAGPAKGRIERFSVAAGPVARTIVEHAREHGADLIVLARRRSDDARPFGRPETGSVPVWVARHAACPTLSLNRA